MAATSVRVRRVEESWVVAVDANRVDTLPTRNQAVMAARRHARAHHPAELRVETYAGGCRSLAY